MKKSFINLYAITVYTIFQKCFKKAGLLNNGELSKSKWAFELRDKMMANEQTTDSMTEDAWMEYQNYLRDKYNSLLKIITLTPERKIGYEEIRIMPLFKYAGEKNYKAFNRKFADVEKKEHLALQPLIETVPTAEPVTIPALYSPTRFGIADFLRNPDNGVIHFYANGDFVFEGAVSLFIKRDFLTKVGTHHMFGNYVLWVKINYEKEGKARTAYFAQIAPEISGAKPVYPENILQHINKL